jgi:outer membrane protein OmpA-like peptidoglycan-associated protein
MKKITISFTLASLLFFSGCATDNAFMDNVGKIGGTTAGAGIGAVIGKQLGGKQGLVIGALVGGGIGYLVGDEIDKRRAELAKIAEQEKVEVLSKNITSSNLELSQNNQKNEPDKKEEVIGDSFTVISDDSQFDVGSSSLNPKSTQLFTKVAKEYSSTNKKILIIGNTDDSGDSSYNQKLSEERARNVGVIFSNQGIKQSNIYYLGAGEMNPIADNNNVDGAKKNRRVEIVELNDLKDIALYSSKTSTPEYFKKIAPKTKIAKNESVIEKNKDIEKAKEQKPTTQKSVSEEKILTDEKIPLIDFKGQKVSSNSFELKQEFGNSLQDKNFSLINKAYANNDTKAYVNCLYDKPRTVGKTKSLENDKDINYSTTEFKKGLNEVPWIANIDNNLVGINPIGVLSNGSTITKNPKVTIYKDYSGNSNQKADLSVETSVNTYQGTDGLIYRIFLEENNSNLECMDIVFSERNVNNSKGIVYYSKKDSNYERDFNITQIRK